MRVTEGHALAHEPVGEVGGEQQGIGGGLAARPNTFVVLVVGK